MSKFVETYTKNYNLPVCNYCKNHIKGLKCKAFDVIPKEILFMYNNHTKPLPEQTNEIVFEPINKL
jgi:hypothetical protein